MGPITPAASVRYQSRPIRRRFNRGVPRIQPPGQRLRSMEGEDVPAARLGIEAVSKPGLNTGALVQERQGASVGGQVVGKARAILLGLYFDAGKRVPLGLGFHYPCGLAIDIKKVVCPSMTRLQRKLPDRYSVAGVQVDG